MFDKLRKEVIGNGKKNDEVAKTPTVTKGAEYTRIMNLIGAECMLTGVGVVNKPEVNKEGKIVLSKEGKVFVRPVVYIGFTIEGYDYFTITNSNLIVRQIEATLNEKLYEKGEGVFDIEIPALQFEMFTIDTEFVTYRNGMEYELPILRSVE